MISPFSQLMDIAVESHFRKDPSGRLVFIPFGLKKKCYFVESRSDEDKIRAFVRMYRSATQLISLIAIPGAYLPGMFLDIYAGLSPKGHRMAIAIGIPFFVYLAFIALTLMIWGVYKKAVPSVTASLSEVGPELKGQLIAPPQSRRVQRVAIGIALACMGLGILILFAVSSRPHSRVIQRAPSTVCPQSNSVTISPAELALSKWIAK
ncbi:MAG: hypothetical protein WCA49_25285 [Candidatus Sulfotelmatobacter sp.]